MKKYINITVSLIALVVVAILVFKYCKPEEKYTKKDLNDALRLQFEVSAMEYGDSLEFVRGQLSLQEEKTKSQTEKVFTLEHAIDSLTRKHEVTKKKMDSVFTLHPVSTGSVLAPNEYVTECESCFELLNKYKKENVQLRFERDSYDTLMRQQGDISENRVKSLNGLVHDYQMALKKSIPACDTSRKVKLSAMGMFGNPFLPKGGGIGLIYEDKKFNEYGGHIVFTNAGAIYIFNLAKTISFRRKK